MALFAREKKNTREKQYLLRLVVGCVKEFQSGSYSPKTLPMENYVFRIKDVVATAKLQQISIMSQYVTESQMIIIYYINLKVCNLPFDVSNIVQLLSFCVQKLQKYLDLFKIKMKHHIHCSSLN